MDDLIRRFFGIGHGARHGSMPHDSEVPSTRESYQDQDVFMDRRGFFGPRSDSLDEMFEHFHQDMFQQMESLHRQMEDMFKGFGAMDYPSDFSAPSIAPHEPENEGSENKIFTWSGPSPFFRRSPDYSKKSLRDFMLKEEDKEGLHSEIGRPKSKDGPALDMPRWDKSGPSKMEDTDLDGKMSDENVLALIKRPEEDKKTNIKIHSPQNRPGSFFSSQSSVRISTFNGQDGKVEQKRVVRDSNGREESSITRTIGDKSYTVTTVTDDSGAQEKHEKLQNMEEGDLSKFEELWSKPRHEKPRSSPGESMLSPRSPSILPVDPHDQGLFYKLFGERKN